MLDVRLPHIYFNSALKRTSLKDSYISDLFPCILISVYQQISFKYTMTKDMEYKGQGICSFKAQITTDSKTLTHEN